MRAILALLVFMFLSQPLRADEHADLYRLAGWPQQRAHFLDALSAAQQRYRQSLPPAVYQALVDNSNRRFAATAMDGRAEQMLRTQLADPAPALAFFGSPTGRKVVAAELNATRADQLARNANGLPRIQAESTRALLIRRLAQAVPFSQAGAEVSLALAGIAADSLSGMLPGLFANGQADGLMEGQRQRLVQRIDNDLDNTLLYVYRDLSDPELDEYVEFAQSPAGQAYYQAALPALRAGLGAQ